MRRWVPGSIRRLLRSADQSDDDVRAELEFHLEERVAELEAEGLEGAAARARAAREFGDRARVERETLRVARQRVRRLRWRDRLDLVGRDASYAVRLLTRSPGFAAAALLTLALGIGATTAVFSVVDAVMIRPLPYEDPDRLVVVWETNAAQEIERDQPSPPNFVDWREGNRTLEGLTAWEDRSVTLTGVDEPEVLETAAVAPDFFDLLGVRPVLGRPLRGSDLAAGDAAVAVIGYGVWQRHLGGSHDIIGQTIELEGRPVEVVGVAPAWFSAPRESVELWVPTDLADPEHHRQSRYLGVIGRLAPGVTLEQAESDLNVIAARLAREYPQSNAGWGVRLVPARDEVLGDSGVLLTVLVGAVGLLLLLACVNVSNMLLGRAAARDRELAVRSALGASGGRLRGQLLVESLILALLAGALGALIARLGVPLILAIEPEAVPRSGDVSLDHRALLFALAVSMGTAVLLGVAPGVRAGRTPPAGALREAAGAGGGRSRSGRRALVVAELALSLVLLVGSALLIRTFVSLRSIDTGYATDGVLTAKVDLNADAYRTGAARVRYFESLLERISALPGVQATGITSTIPLDPAGIDFDLPYRRAEDPPLPEEDLPQVDYRIVSAGYTDAMGIALVSGRDIETTDRAGAPRVLLINQELARRLWPGESAVGKRMVVHYVDDAGLEWEVIGVTADTRHAGLTTSPSPQMFIPLGQAEYLFGYMSLVVRTRGEATALVRPVTRAALAVDPAEPLFDVATMESLRADAMARERLAAALLGIFALIALALAAAGVYGVVSYQVARRTREIGVRMALGAGRPGVLRLVVGETAVTAVIGVALGLLGAVAATRLLAGLLFGVGRFDPATYAATSATLLAIALLAAWLPARRAAAVDPVSALRAD